MARVRSAPGPTSLPDPIADAAALRAFVAVARLGSVVRAARTLARTQPSVSARLAALESAWGVRLFRRRARGMEPTPEGARLLPLAEAALHVLEEVDRAAGRPAASRGELRVGAGDALGRELLPRAFSRVLHGTPNLAVRLVEGPGPRLLDALDAGEIDVALVVLSPDSRRRDGIRAEPLLESAVDVLFPPGEAPRARRAADLEVLGGRRVVALQPGSEFRRHVEAAAASRGIALRPAVEVGNFSLVRRFVAAGLGAGPVPAVAFRRDAPGPPVERRRLQGVAPVPYFAAMRRGAPQSDEIAGFLAILRREAAGLRG